MIRCFTGLSLLVALTCTAVAEDAEKPQADAVQPVSFYRQVRPILQRQCAGCHQPAKAGGTLVVTDYAAIAKGGENGPGFVAEKPDESPLVSYISGDDPQMPLNGDPLPPQQVELIRRWVAEGAKDDTPAGVQDTITAENPPTYQSPPVITSLDYSPDGQLLAVSGFHEVLLHRVNEGGLDSRLVGRAPRIESVAFSPDGQWLGVAGGAPALFGELQIWKVADRSLAHSVSVAHDTLFGVSFSDDSKNIAFGAGDNRARVFRVEDAEQIMRFDAHADYVFGTTFSQKLDHLITVSRDMSMKLAIIENAQFVDNVTSITPGALKGGLMAVQRHPKKEQVLCGGADGEPRLYKIFRTRKRIIGDDFNHIRSYTALPGRVCSLDFNADGSLFVVGSSTATAGAARIYRTGDYETDPINNDGSLEDTRVAINQRSAENMVVHELAVTSPVYAVSFRPDGKQVAIGGFDGTVRLFNAETGALEREFIPVEVAPEQTASSN